MLFARIQNSNIAQYKKKEDEFYLFLFIITSISGGRDQPNYIVLGHLCGIKYAVLINEYIQAHQDQDESDAKKRLKRSASKDISRNLSCLRYLKKYMKKM